MLELCDVGSSDSDFEYRRLHADRAKHNPALSQQERVVGLHIMGPNAADILQGFVAAMKCGLTKQQLDATVGIHPGSAQVSIPFFTLFHKNMALMAITTQKDYLFLLTPIVPEHNKPLCSQHTS